MYGLFEVIKTTVVIKNLFRDEGGVFTDRLRESWRKGYGWGRVSKGLKPG